MKSLRCVLIADDDPDDLDFTKSAFSELPLSCHIVAAKDGVEAMEYLLRSDTLDGGVHAGPDLILLDIKMPRLDGIEVLRQIKTDEKLRLIPVVMFTSSAEVSDVKTCYGFGANGYVVKPMKPQDFKAAIRDIGMFWIETNETTPRAVV